MFSKNPGSEGEVKGGWAEGGVYARKEGSMRGRRGLCAEGGVYARKEGYTRVRGHPVVQLLAHKHVMGIRYRS